MPFDFNSLLREGTVLKNMPPVTISERNTDKKVLYHRLTTRLDRIAGDIYGDETLWKLILWANPAYFLEFDIPNNTVIRVPYPVQEVLAEVQSQIIINKSRG